MYIRKDAASSSQIEGTQATIIDTIEAETRTSESLPEDVNDCIITKTGCSNLDSDLNWQHEY
ncbi:MAG: hypothetical protein GF417_05085 [Candidatus Latescibacteria bacterium]|nr:hypothetical protein [bacterium]MBD3423793.1 hypothetical protein [Candidatus Latescibacterota bacterium]